MKEQDIRQACERRGRRYRLQASGPDVARILLMAVILISLLIALAMLSSCGGGATVTMKELRFEPDAVTIKKGETVSWKNEDRRERQVMSGHPPVMTDEFMSPVLKTGESWSFSFDQAGEYAYHDMKIPGLPGRVIVEE